MLRKAKAPFFGALFSHYTRRLAKTRARQTQRKAEQGEIGTHLLHAGCAERLDEAAMSTVLLKSALWRALRGAAHGAAAEQRPGGEVPHDLEQEVLVERQVAYIARRRGGGAGGPGRHIGIISKCPPSPPRRIRGCIPSFGSLVSTEEYHCEGPLFT